MEKELIDYVVKSLVDNPDSVEVMVEETDEGIDLKLKVASEDIGKVIGKQGRVAKALRTLLGAVAVKSGKSANLEILD